MRKMSAKEMGGRQVKRVLTHLVRVRLTPLGHFAARICRDVCGQDAFRGRRLRTLLARFVNKLPSGPIAKLGRLLRLCLRLLAVGRDGIASRRLLRHLRR